MGFQLLASVLMGLIISFPSAAESVACPTGTVTVDVTSTADVQNLMDVLNCTGQGYFSVNWYSSLTVLETINVESLKNVTITGFAFYPILGSPDANNGGGAAIDASGETGIFSVSDRSTLSLNNLILAGGNAENGGSVHLTSTSSLFVNGCNFTNNNASNGGAIYANDSKIHIAGETVFAHSSADYEGGAIYARSSEVYMDGNTSFEHNTAENSGGAMYVDASGVFMNGITTFVENFADDQAGVMYVESSEVYMKGQASFVRNRASHNAGAMRIIRSKVYMEGHSSFLDNWAEDAAGAVDINNSEVYMEGITSFDGHSAAWGGAMRVTTSEIFMKGNTSFVNNGYANVGAAIAIDHSEVYMDGITSFTDNWAGSGGALFVSEAKVYMDGSTSFVNNRADDDGGAIYCTISEIRMKGSTIFVTNSADYGGDIYHKAKGAQAVIPSVRFIGNTANKIGGAMRLSDSLELNFQGVAFASNNAKLGGGIYVLSTEDRHTHFSYCVFEGNKASEGGALYLAAISGVDRFESSWFQDNSAEFSGGAIFHLGSLYLVNSSFVGNKVAVEGPAILSIGPIQELSNVSFSENAFNCRPGKYGYVVEPEGGFCASCFEEVCARCSTGHLVDTEFENVRTNGTPVCGDPPAGAIAQFSGTTVVTLTLDRGYYRTSNQSHAILKCYQRKACIGGNDTANYCAVGYKGPYCAVCVDGYTPGIAYSCHKCSADIERSAVGRTVAVTMAALLLVTLLFAHLGSVVLPGAWEDTGEVQRSWGQRCWSCQTFVVKILPVRAIKIVVTVWQIISQFGAIAGDVYPKVYTAFVTKLTPINLDLDVVLSYSCIITTDFYHHLLLATISPALVTVTFAGSYLVAKKRNSTSDSAMVTVLHKHQAAALYLAFFVYSPVSYKILQTFACDELDDGNSYLRADYSLSCLTPRHSWYKAYALVMVCVYPVGIAAVFAFLLARYRHELVKPQREFCPSLQPFHGLWAAYKPSRYFYEVIECGRRISLTAIAAFVPSNSAAQISLVLLFAVVFVFISEAISPFQKSGDTNLYRWGNAIIVASMYVAFLLKIDVGYDTDDTLLTFSGVLILANVFMVVTVLLQTALLMNEWRRVSVLVRALDEPVRRTT